MVLLRDTWAWHTYLQNLIDTCKYKSAEAGDDREKIELFAVQKNTSANYVESKVPLENNFLYAYEN